MAISAAPITSYSDTTAHKKVISDLISIIDPVDTPVVAYFGLEGGPGKFEMVNWPSTKVSWLTDDYAALSDSLATSINSTIVTFAASSGNGKKFKKGHILMSGTEQMWVSSVSTDTLTVTRAYNSSTGASALKSATITIIGMARLEGATTDDDYKTDVLQADNYTQIFHGGIKVTGSHQVLSQYGLSDEFDYQARKKVPELTRLIEKAFFLGKSASGSTTVARRFGGVEQYVTTNTATMAAAALTEKQFNDSLATIWDAGGSASVAIMGQFVKRKIAQWYADTIRTERSERMGGMLITRVETEFGEIDLLRSRWCPVDKLYLVSPEHIGFLAYRPFFQEPMSKSGDYERGQVVGEYSMVVRHQTAHAYIKSISTTS